METAPETSTATSRFWAHVEKLGRADLQKLGWAQDAIDDEILKRAAKRNG